MRNCPTTQNILGNLRRRPVALTLGSCGFPDNNTKIREFEKDGAKAIVLKGYDATGRKKQLAMTIFGGFGEIGCVSSKGTNPDSECSLIVYALAELNIQYNGCEPYVFVSQTITKESHEDFSENEIFPIADIRYTDEVGCAESFVIFGPEVKPVVHIFSLRISIAVRRFLINDDGSARFDLIYLIIQMKF